MTDLETRMRDIEGWAREHDGKIDAKWDEQDRQNDRCNDDRAELRKHIDSQFGLVNEGLAKIRTVVAAYAAAGTVIATVAAKYLLP